MNEEEIKIKFKKDEAIVLYELVYRINEDQNNNIFQDQAEQRVIWDIEAILEKKLFSETTKEDYLEIVKKAREKIRNEF